MARDLESPESSSPIITRSVAAGLMDRYCETYQFLGWQRFALHQIGKFPQGVARFLISQFEKYSSLPPREIQNLSIDSLIQERLKDYHDRPDKLPALVMGSPLGGAAAHISLALGGPFLPQAFVITIQGGSKNGDVLTYHGRSAKLAQAISARNPNILTIQHYDPVHDEWMTRYANHLRFKLLDLPELYKNFIEQTVQDGGAITYLDCTLQWPRYRLGERSVFQVGGWGDLTPHEFLNGSDRLEQYCRQVKLKGYPWKLSDFPLEDGRESEWGSEPGLAEALQEFCQRKGYQFTSISLPGPHEFAILAFRSMVKLLEKENRQPAGVIIEMFSQFDAPAVIKAGLLPLWLVFNTRDGLKIIEHMKHEFPHDKPVFFSPLATFTHTPDLAAWSDWVNALEGINWQNIGTRADHYPADAQALINWAKPLRAWVNDHPMSIQARLSLDELAALASGIKSELPN